MSPANPCEKLPLPAFVLALDWYARAHPGVTVRETDWARVRAIADEILGRKVRMPDRKGVRDV